MNALMIIDNESEIAEIVRSMHTVAVVGMKDETQSDAPAHEVPRAMKGYGMRVLPVNPRISTALGEAAVARLADLQERPDVVQVFRRSDAIDGVAEEILQLPPERRPSVVWLQTGIRNDAAAARLAAAGMRVVQDRCLMVDSAKYRSRP